MEYKIKTHFRFMSIMFKQGKNKVDKLELRSYKYRIYPSKTAEKRMIDTLEACRLAYNELLQIKVATYETTGKSLSKFDLNKCIKQLSVDTSSVHSQVLQNVSDRLGKTFQNFFRRVKEKKLGKIIKVGYPRYKKKINSFAYPQNGYNLNNHKLYLSKIGEVGLRIGKKQNKIKGNIKTLTVKRYPSGKWFAIFACEIDIKIQKHTNKKIGIDVGLENFATLSDGTKIENHRFLVNSEKRLNTLNRRLSRKKKGSNRRNKAKIKLACIHEKISNQRYDFLHKTTKMLVDKFGHIAVENLNIKNMVKHPYLAKHINDASWGNFVRILDYKASSAGCQVDKVNPKGTSQICSQCGHKVPKTLATRWHRCPVCGLHISRDFNSAKIILKRATVGTTGSYAHEDGSSLLEEILEDSPSMKCEAHML